MANRHLNEQNSVSSTWNLHQTLKPWVNFWFMISRQLRHPLLMVQLLCLRIAWHFVSRASSLEFTAYRLSRWHIRRHRRRHRRHRRFWLIMLFIGSRFRGTSRNCRRCTFLSAVPKDDPGDERCDQTKHSDTTHNTACNCADVRRRAARTIIGSRGDASVTRSATARSTCCSSLIIGGPSARSDSRGISIGERWYRRIALRSCSDITEALSVKGVRRVDE